LVKNLSPSSFVVVLLSPLPEGTKFLTVTLISYCSWFMRESHIRNSTQKLNC
jgi:hypothetical protein